MLGFTHFFVAILIWKLLGASPLAMILVALILVFLSHFLLDMFGILTYHPRDPKPQDKFWVSHQIYQWAFNIIIVIFYWNLIPILMVSIIPDIVDWWALRSLKALKVKIPFETPVIHERLIKNPKFLPDWSNSKKSAIPEFLLAVGWGLYLFL